MDNFIYIILVSSIFLQNYDTAIVPPPWSDPNKNPCATLPGGWQLLYWLPLQKCFKIFTKGYPCPDTMELSPITITSSHKSSSTSTMDLAPISECRCPPGTAQFNADSICYKIYERGPCEIGQYFSPIPAADNHKKIKKRLAKCEWPSICKSGMLFWPPDEKCYTVNTRGPCSKGKLINYGKEKLAECLCENYGELAQFYYSSDDSCYEHFTRGPCDNGQIFLPDRECGCHIKLPHYYPETDQCFEIDTIGPCPLGHIFKISENRIQRNGKDQMAKCQCKENYVLWMDGLCYRKYTRGPCDDGQFLVNETKCLDNPCAKSRLYFPEQQLCYRIGSQGPCPIHKVVVFDFTTRPSLDGISYNGICGCMGIIANLDQKCSAEERAEDKRIGASCESMHGMIRLNGNCYKLYTRGPCGQGQWLEPKKIVNRNDKRGAECQCRPGYNKRDISDGNNNKLLRCYSPSVGIARYLNGRNHNTRSYKLGFRRYI